MFGIKAFVLGLLVVSVSADRLQVRQASEETSDVAPGWVYSGCYTDSVSRHSLPINSGLDPEAVTNEKCIQYCTDNGYAYAGTEFSRECYCGNSILNGGKRASVEDCNLPCTGDKDETCGGSNRLTLFNNSGGDDDGGPSVNPGVNGYRSLGCFSDDVHARTLLTQKAVPGGGQKNISVAACTAACAAGGFAYAGVEFGQECYCGNVISNNGTLVDDQTDCDMVCTGNLTEYCGGPSHLNLYSSKVPTGWKPLGCYVDSVANRTLDHQIFSIPAQNMTNEACLTACRGGGFTYSGTEYGGECFCGNKLLHNAGPAPDGNRGCNFPCKGDIAETCGGSNRLTLFRFDAGKERSFAAFMSPIAPEDDLSTLPEHEGGSSAESSSTPWHPPTSSKHEKSSTTPWHPPTSSKHEGSSTTPWHPHTSSKHEESSTTPWHPPTSSKHEESSSTPWHPPTSSKHGESSSTPWHSSTSSKHEGSSCTPCPSPTSSKHEGSCCSSTHEGSCCSSTHEGSCCSSMHEGSCCSSKHEGSCSSKHEESCCTARACVCPPSSCNPETSCTKTHKPCLSTMTTVVTCTTRKTCSAHWQEE